MSRKLLIVRRFIAVGSASALLGLVAGGCASGGSTTTTHNNGGAGGGGGYAGDSGIGATGGDSGLGGGGGTTGGTGGVSGDSGVGGTGGSTGGTGGSTGGTGGATGGTGGATGGTGGGGCSTIPETCNGLDDNCDGQIDEGNPGGGGTCTVAGKNGVCAAGTNQCINGVVTCVQDTQPSSETCDGLDNNCDGQIDEGNPGGNSACNTGQPGVCASGTTACSNGSIVCNQNFTATTEACNGLDDNCDGQTDENNPGGGANCDTGKLGECAAGTTDCQSGQLKCVQKNTAAAEVCDNKDNDCNGSIDDNITSTACNSGQPGICGAGMTQCAGGVGSCVATVKPGDQQEKCDGKDDDCNGSVDDGSALTLCARNCGIASIPNVTTMACTTGACVISACPAGRYDSDGSYCNGCEAQKCTSTPAPNTCATAIGLNGTGDSYSGQLLTVGASAWFRVSFTNPGAGISYNPTISLANGAGEYSMAVLTGCGGTAIACPASGGTKPGGSGEVGTGNNVTSWSMNFNVNLGNCGGAAQGACTNKSAVPSGDVYIKITRTAITGSGQFPECDQFAISITN